MSTLLKIEIPQYLSPKNCHPLLERLQGITAASTDLVILEGSSADFCLGFQAVNAETLETYEQFANVEAAVRAFSDCLEVLRLLPVPSIAVCKGKTAGGGIALACACDQIFAETSATFSIADSDTQAPPAIVVPLLLERLSIRALRQFALKEEFSREDALRLGLVDVVLDAKSNSFKTALDSLMAGLSQNSTTLLGNIKRYSADLQACTFGESLAYGIHLTTAQLTGQRTRARNDSENS